MPEGGKSMPYNNIISRSDVDVFLPEEQATEVLQAAIEQSAALRFFRTVPMSTKTRRVPVLATLPIAYFVNGDTGLKQTTEMAWSGKMLEAEEIATIVPIPEAVLDDADHDLWAEVRPRLAEAVGKCLDAAVFFGTNKPASWPTGVVPAAVAAGNVVTRGTATPDEGGVAGDISELFSAVENDGFVVSGMVASGKYRGYLRNARDANGVLLSEIAGGTIYGVPVQYGLTGYWPTGAGAAEALAGDFSMGVIGVRQDLTYKLLDQAVITDDTGNIVYNLPQQDMLALRVVARFAWSVANPPTAEQPVEAQRSPFAVMQAA
jgi:HK97 family phage major capsid protein